MKNVYLLAFVCLFFALESCKENDQSIAEDVVSLDFKQAEKGEPNDLLITDYIKLETKDLSLIDKSIIQLEFASEKIFILSGGSDRNLLVFDISGNFIQRIGSKGNGPGEFINPASFSINNETDIISVVDFAQKKAIDYNLSNFNFIAKNTLDHYSTCFEYLDGELLLLKNTDYQSSYKDWEFLLTDTDFNIKDSYVNKEFKTGYSTGHTKSIYKNEGQVYAYAQYNPTIYRFQEGSMEPAYYIKFGEFNLPPKDYLDKISANNENFLSTLDVSDYVYNYCVFGTENILNVYYSVAQEAYIGLYNKNNGRVYNFPKRYFDEKMNVGYMDRPSGTINDFVVSVLQPFDLRERLNEGYNFDPKLKELIQESKDDDNPILFLYKFKG